MGNMLGMGQAAGVAAAVSVQGATSPRNVDVGDVQRRLVAMGIDLGIDLA
jgi:hypothetical protein